MNLDRVKPVVDAVLYEGYILYPYRPTATKNRQRWTFGGVYPEAYYRATGGADPCRMQTQCLVEGEEDTRLEVRVRFLHPLARDVGELRQPLNAWPEDGEPAFRTVSSLTVDETCYHPWQEAVERDVAVADCRLGELARKSRHVHFAFEARREVEPLAATDGTIRGLFIRSQIEIQGRIALSAKTVAAGVHRLTVRIENRTPIAPAAVSDRERASLYSFASTHTILGASGGGFVSLMDPPARLRDAAAACENQDAWPVLVGEPGARDTLLASPIILYDHPEVAPESPGDLYDATEIDELLSLSILALTDTEKREMAAADPRARALLQRAESLGGDDFLRMHGALRDPAPRPTVQAGDEPEKPVESRGAESDRDGGNPLEPEPKGPRLTYCDVGGRALKVGDRVRLKPHPGGDVMDLVLAGKTAVIEAIERDFDDRLHIAVAVDDDPGREWGLQRMPGHRFFFSPEEIEPLPDESHDETRPA